VIVAAFQRLMVDKLVGYILKTQQNEILKALKGIKEQQMALTQQVAHLIEEVNQSRGLVASMATFVRGVPALVRQAVQEALAANPGLSPDDLSALTEAADSLDAGQADILSALQSNQVPGENTGVPPERTEMGGIEPAPVEPEPLPAPIEPSAGGSVEDEPGSAGGEQGGSGEGL
jgi:hypothetical protein